MKTYQTYKDPATRQVLCVYRTGNDITEIKVHDPSVNQWFTLPDTQLVESAIPVEPRRPMKEASA